MKRSEASKYIQLHANLSQGQAISKIIEATRTGKPVKIVPGLTLVPVKRSGEYNGRDVIWDFKFEKE